MLFLPNILLGPIRPQTILEEKKVRPLGQVKWSFWVAVQTSGMLERVQFMVEIWTMAAQMVASTWHVKVVRGLWDWEEREGGMNVSDTRKRSRQEVVGRVIWMFLLTEFSCNAQTSNRKYMFVLDRAQWWSRL